MREGVGPSHRRGTFGSVPNIMLPSIDQFRCTPSSLTHHTFVHSLETFSISNMSGSPSGSGPHRCAFKRTAGSLIIHDATRAHTPTHTHTPCRRFVDITTGLEKTTNGGEVKIMIAVDTANNSNTLATTNHSALRVEKGNTLKLFKYTLSSCTRHSFQTQIYRLYSLTYEAGEQVQHLPTHAHTA